MNSIFTIDFGLSKFYRDSKSLQHCRFQQNRFMTGTARYSSINAILGYEQSRRDDLESIFYIIIYFIQGSLPWQSIVLDDIKERLSKISELKLMISSDELCKGMPIEFKKCLDYCKSLKFEQDPDYGLLKKWINDVLIENKFENDGVYNWSLVKYVMM
jgi:serine/threonine protein kinase